MKERKKVQNNKINKWAEYSCSICFFYPTEPIVTPCGHIFCWPCYYYASKLKEHIHCYVCQTKIRFIEVCPVYSGNSIERSKHMTGNNVNIPPRPRTLCKIVKKRINVNYGSRKIEFRVTRRDQSFIILFCFVFILYLYYLKNKCFG